MDQNTLNAQLAALTDNETLIIEGLDDNVYHAAYDELTQLPAIGSSNLVSFIKAPARFKFDIEQGQQEETPEHFLVGSASHCLLLEALTFNSRYAVLPEGMKKDKRTKAYKEFLEENQGKDILTIKQLIQSRAMADSTRRQHSQFFSGGQSEVSYFRRDKNTGLVVKARIDYRINNLAIDYKTTKDAEPVAFERSIYNLKYYIQAAHYLAVSGLDGFAFVPVEKTPPYLTSGPYVLSEEALIKGSKERDNALEKLAECNAKNDWPGYRCEVITCELPYYMQDKLEQANEGV
jgi:hypothetical protein